MPFKPGQSGNATGRPVKSELWKDAEKEIREALPRLLRMDRSLMKKVMSQNPTGAEMVAYAYIMRYPVEVIARFLPGSWADEPVASDNVTPEQLLKIIAMGKPTELPNGHASA